MPEALFDRTQAALQDKRPSVPQRRRHNPEFPLRAFVRCSDCQRPLTAGFSKGQHGKRFPFYRCQSGCFNVSRREIESDFIELLKRLRPKPETVEALRKAVLQVWEEKLQTATTAKGQQEALSRKLRERKDLLVEAYLFEKKIGDDEYQAQLDKLNQALPWLRCRPTTRNSTS